MEKFTKGGWIAFYPHEVLNEGLMSIGSDVGKLICKAELYKSTITEVTANANLIAAAPEMYAMLKLISDLSLITDDKGLSDEIDNLLAKARGE